jgi:ATP-binding cassette subfamily B protein
MLFKKACEHLGVHRWTYEMLWQVSPFYTVGMIVCSFLSGLTPILFFIALRGLIDDQLSSAGKSPMRWLGLMLFIGCIEATVSLAQRLFRQVLREKAVVDINELILRQSLNKPIAFFEQSRSQDQFDKINSNCADRMVDLISRNSQVFSSTLQVITTAYVLARIEPLVILVIPPCFVPYLWYQIKLGSSSAKEIQQRVQERRKTGYFLGMLTSIQGVVETRMLGIADHLIEKFRDISSATRDKEIGKQVWQFLASAVFAVASVLLFFGLIGRLLYNRDSSGVTLGSIVLFTGASLRLRKSFEDATLAISSIANHTLYLSYTMRFLSETKHKQERTLSTELCSSFYPEISFENVTFRYDGQVQDAIKDVSFTIRPGETIAIVGENGSGKSTLVKLLAGIYQPQSGAIQISGHNISQVDLKSLHQNLAFVFQDFNRYNASLVENVAYGNWVRYSSYTPDEQWKDLEPCVMSAGLIHEMKKMPQAQETILGRVLGGYELSKGVWQRIAMARAYARRAQVLIMDEPTSAIDAKAEYEMFKLIGELSEGRTTILISHRFTTVTMASRIFVMESGQLVETGTHADLLQLNGRYAALYNYHRALHKNE